MEYGGGEVEERDEQEEERRDDGLYRLKERHGDRFVRMTPEEGVGWVLTVDAGIARNGEVGEKEH